MTDPDAPPPPSSPPPPAPTLRRARPKRTRGQIKALNLIIFAVILFVVGRLYFLEGDDAATSGDLLSVPATHADPAAIQRLRFDEVNSPDRLNVRDRMIPYFRDAVGVQILQRGVGAPSVCGQTAEFVLVTPEDQTRVSDPMRVTLGDPAQPMGLSLGLLDMGVNEVRQLQIPLSLWDPAAARGVDKAKQETILRLARLDSAAPPIPKTRFTPRRFIDTAGSGQALRCGDAAVLHVTIAKADGTVLVDSTADNTPFYFELGLSQAPFGLEDAAIGMEPGGVYTLLLPPEWMKPLAAPKPAAQPTSLIAKPFPVMDFPADQLLIATVSYPVPRYTTSSPQPIPPSTDQGKP